MTTPENSNQSDQSEQPELSDEQVEFLNSLFDFAREGKVIALSSVIDQGVPVDLRDHDGDTFLILASYREQPEVVAALLERGADVNILNNRGQSALTSAVFMQNKDITRMLLDAGADPDYGPQSARSVTQVMGLDEMAKFLDSFEQN